MTDRIHVDSPVIESTRQILPPRDQKAYDLGRSSRNAEVCGLLDVIRNQNTQMAWQQEQLDLAGARERAYVDILNGVLAFAELCREAAKGVLEGPLAGGQR